MRGLEEQPSLTIWGHTSAGPQDPEAAARGSSCPQEPVRHSACGHGDTDDTCTALPPYSPPYHAPPQQPSVRQAGQVPTFPLVE